MTTNDLNLADWLRFRGYQLNPDAPKKEVERIASAANMELQMYGRVTNGVQHLAYLISIDAVVENTVTRSLEKQSIRLTRLLDCETLPFPEHVARLVVLGRLYGEGDAYCGMLLRNLIDENKDSIRMIIKYTIDKEPAVLGPVMMLPYIKELKSRSKAVRAWMEYDREKAVSALEEEYGVA